MSARLTWRGIEIEVKHEVNWLNTGLHHIEVFTEPRTRLPITETGYRSEFVSEENFATYKDAADYVLTWLEEAGKDWNGQMTLF